MYQCPGHDYCSGYCSGCAVQIVQNPRYDLQHPTANPTIVRKTGYALNFDNETLLEQLESEYADMPATFAANKRWKLVNHLGRANFVPFGATVGRSIGTITIEWVRIDGGF